MGTELLCIDAFTAEAFRGNPAAVCLLEAPREVAWMQALAAELNLSETAFVVPLDEGFDLRWFTPTSEVELCGHATLASAHALWETGRLSPDAAARFRTRWRGELVATRSPSGIALDLPAAPSTVAPEPRGLSAALGASIRAVARNDLHHIAELECADAVRSLRPDFGALRLVDVEGVAVTAASDEPGYDFVSRYFTPRFGVDEDPVTGAAHTSLGPWWAEKLGKRDLVGYQASRRGGVVHVHVPSSPVATTTRVTLTGPAVIVWRGHLEV